MKNNRIYKLIMVKKRWEIKRSVEKMFLSSFWVLEVNDKRDWFIFGFEKERKKKEIKIRDQL